MVEKETGQSRRMRMMGSGGNCVCPKCGYTVAHQPGVPCRKMRCPTCDIRLQREGSQCQHG